MKYSIKQQFAGVFCLLIIGTIGVCWFINNTFLENYYIRNKQNVLMNAYNYMNTASNEGKIVTEEFDIEFQKIYSVFVRSSNVILISYSSPFSNTLIWGDASSNRLFNSCLPKIS